MKPILLLVLVLNGFAPVALSVQPVPPTYHLINQTMTWPNARNYCTVMYTDLAPIKTYNDLLRIRNDAASQGVTWPIWIGLYNQINSWRWSYNDASLYAIPFQKWNPGEPNNYKGIESCGILYNVGTWGDYACFSVLPFICYNDQYSGNSMFIGISSPMLNWTNAQAYCRRFHTDLASALDAADNSLLQQIAAGQGLSWFGLYRNTWTWSDYTKAQNVYWLSGQPDNYYTNENCGRFCQGYMDDAPCSNIHSFYCHYIPPIKRKMLKLQVKSDQSVFDPAVQSALLTKILQKLGERVMLEDITVTWRVQRDGNIFHKKNDL